MEKLIIRQENSGAKKYKKRREKKVLESAIKLFNARRDIIDFFGKRIFSFKGNVFKTKGEE